MDKDFEIEITGMGNNITSYPGAFTPVVNKIIEMVIEGKTLQLFSGVSKIGDERVDIERPEATIRKDVLNFIKEDKRDWDFVILDPPYEIKRKSKIEEYGRTSSVASDVILRRELSEYFLKHTQNILWLDMCAPLPKGFRRKKIWFLFPGGYHTIRILSWLEKDLSNSSPPVRTSDRKSDFDKSKEFNTDLKEVQK